MRPNVMLQNNKTQEQSLKAVEKALVRATESEKFMVAVWAIENDRLELVTRTTWDFPTMLLKEAVRLLSETISVEIARGEQRVIPFDVVRPKHLEGKTDESGEHARGDRRD